LIDQLSHEGYGLGGLVTQNGFNHQPDEFVRHGPDQHFQILMLDALPAEGDGLIQQAQRISHAAFTGSSQGR
jgi:hypothetical protein